MFSSEALAVVYGLASAASWGAGDFSGGFATKRSHVYSVIILSQFIGALFLLALAFLLGEQISAWVDLLLGAAAGISGMVGLSALYSGLARGRMAVVAPVVAVISAVLPLGVSLIVEGLPAVSKLAGFAIALIAVWLLAGAGQDGAIQLRELGLPLIAGLGFGLFFIIIDRVSQGAVLWPLTAARVASVIFLTVIVVVRQQVNIPSRNQLPVIVLAGIFDTGGNAFFLLAAQVGRLDIAAVLSSLYPAATVLLAWLILKERLVRQQAIGVFLALLALILIAL